MCCAKIWLKLDSGFVEEVQKRKVYRWTDRQTTSMTDRLKKEKNELRKAQENSKNRNKTKKEECIGGPKTIFMNL